jgi:DNA-binding CsgD family transcriptional regulator
MHSNRRLREEDLVLLSRAAHEAELTGDWGAVEGTLRLALSQCEDAAARDRLLRDLHHVHLRSDVRACAQSTLAMAGAAVPQEVKGRELAPLTHLLLAASFAPVSTVLTTLVDDLDTKALTPPPTLVAQADLLRHPSPQRHPSRRTLSDPAVLTARALRLAASGHHRKSCRHLLRRVVPDLISLADRDPMLIGLAALAATWIEELSSARQWATEGATVARADRRPVEEAVNVLVRSLAAERIGLTQEALADSDAARKLFEDVHADAMAEFARAVHAEVCIQLGQINFAAITLDGLRPHADAHPLLSATVAHALGRLAEARGDAAGALAHLMSCPRYLHPLGVIGPSVLMWQPTMVRVLSHSGREDAAHLVAEGHLATARVWGAPGLIGQALHTCASRASGMERIHFLRAAEEELAHAGFEHERCKVLSELAEGYAERGDDEAAQWALGEVATVEVPSPSEPAEHAASCPGVRLSRAEQRVVDLVLEGHSNAGVARMLYLSKRTVDTHLGRIYKKLGINSRAQLTTALDGTLASHG